MGQRIRNAEWPAGTVAVFEGILPVGLGQVDASGLLAPQRLFNL
jgi:tRNA pseudouridine55 synthase